MFIINITYKVPFDKVEEFFQSHMEFINKYYDLGAFHASGKKIPRDGGIIFSLLENKEELLKILEEDPFKSEGIADFQVYEFQPTRASKQFEFLL